MYIIVELQTNASGSVSNLVYTADSAQQADQIYHTKLAYAATSPVYLHAVSMLTNDGSPIKNECYYHVQEPEPTLESEE